MTYKPKSYRKAPVLIEAIQFDGTEECADAILKWARGRGNITKVATALKDQRVVLKIGTLEGVMRAMKGDWIIRGVKGEFYPCKAEIFEGTYIAEGA